GSFRDWGELLHGITSAVERAPPANGCPLARVAPRAIPVIGARPSRAARVAELVDALDLGSSIARCGGSTPSARTISGCPSTEPSRSQDFWEHQTVIKS